MKGLMKSAYYDPNPVVIFEHKGLYWSKVPGTDAAKLLNPMKIIWCRLARLGWHWRQAKAPLIEAKQ